jgi:hypothetical protein
MVYFWINEEYRPVIADRIIISTKNGIFQSSIIGPKMRSIAPPTPSLIEGMPYEIIISMVKTIAIVPP